MGVEVTSLPVVVVAGSVPGSWGSAGWRDHAVVEPTPRSGRLLVATPSIGDPNFERTVVLVLEHDPEGTLGVVLNRPSPVEVSEVLPSWAGLLAAPTVLFEGGPVQREAVVAVARRSPAAESPAAYRAITDALGVVDLTADPVDLVGDVVGMRCFAGYAGWTGGQLVAEIRSGGWWVVEGEADDVVGRDPSGLWRRVLARQAGERSWFAAYPDDPAVN